MTLNTYGIVAICLLIVILLGVSLYGLLGPRPAQKKRTQKPFQTDAPGDIHSKYDYE